MITPQNLSQGAGASAVSEELRATPTRRLSAEANALVDRIRTENPADLASEVYGLDKRLAKEPANLVLELIGTTLPELAADWPGESMQVSRLAPREGEPFAKWMRRMEDEVGGLDLAADRYSHAAYAAIGYDWVSCVWLPKGVNTRTADKATLEAARASADESAISAVTLTADEIAADFTKFVVDASTHLEFTPKNGRQAVIDRAVERAQQLGGGSADALQRLCDATAGYLRGSVKHDEFKRTVREHCALYHAKPATAGRRR